MTEFTARNGAERYVFEGVRLASVSTDDGSLLRWTEITIYRTEAGKYVVEKIGRSLVYHALGGCDFGVEIGPDELSGESQACPICKPAWEPTSPVRLETDRYHTVLTENAPALVDACRMTNNDSRSDSYGTVFMPHVARKALTQAAELDEGIRDAFLTQRIA